VQYLLLLHLDPEAPPADPAPPQAAPDWVSYTDALARAGVLVSGEAVRPPHTATTLRLRGGEQILTDGPFLETRELLIGWYVIDVDDLDAAVRWAAALPLPGQLTVEIRPVDLVAASASARLASR
jgi:hypothetical protein